MISKILGAIKRIFGSSDDYSDHEEEKTDPKVDSVSSTSASTPTPSVDEMDEEADTAVDEPVEEPPAPVVENTPEPVVEETPAAAENVAEESVTVKGVSIDNPAAVLAFANTASEDALKDAGVKGAGLKALLGARPIDAVEGLGSISGFGKKSIESLVNGAS